MHPKQKIKFSEWCIKIELSMWKAADFDSLNVPLESASQNVSLVQLLGSKPVAIDYGRVINNEYNSLNWKKKATTNIWVKIVLHGL